MLSQNETSKWCFGWSSGLDFMTSPPSIVTGYVMTTQEGSASVADAAGNMLFYTDGSKIWNNQNLVMANGFGLTGNTSSTQSALIIKKPGSNTIYYVFTAPVGAGSIAYSTVDMTLAAGLGSVTVLNTLLWNSSTERLTATRHCNGTDIWVITHDANSSNFRCFLVTSSGVSTTPVITSIGTSHNSVNNWLGYMKTSPNGKKLAMCLNDSNGFQLYDFDPSMGVVSNSMSIATYTRAYGIEFSPDGTKLYGSCDLQNTPLHQWDLCAGSPAAISASEFNMTCTTYTYRMALQMASDGKIYIARYNADTLGVINNPNAYGAACNFVELGLAISPGFAAIGLPNFMPSLFKPKPLPYTYVTNNSLYGCQTASFSVPAVSNMTLINCVSAGFSVTSMAWNFGDPASGSANTSTLHNPTHAYSALGTYTTQVILYYSCGGGSDTLRQQVVINQPCINVISSGITCTSPGSATVTTPGGTGPYSYTWMPTSQTSSVATGLYPATYTITVTDLGANTTHSAGIVIAPSTPFTGTLVNSASVSCNGASTGTASINVSGGSGSSSYLWTSGTNTQTTQTASNLGAGIYIITVTDGLGHCSFTNSFTITQPPAFTMTIISSSQSVCLGASITLTSNASGGTAGYTYVWAAGPTTNTYNINKSVAGNYVYSVTSKDFNNCSVTRTTSVTFLANPVPGILSNHTSLCEGSNLTWHGSGGTSYAWNGPNNFISTSQDTTINAISLSANGIYSLIVSAGSCTAEITKSITVFPVPAPIVSASPACENHKLQFTSTATGGIVYSWIGPSGFSSALQNPIIDSVSVLTTGNYSVTVADVNGCKATSSIHINMLLNPLLLTHDTSVCFGNPAVLNVSGALTYSWSGPSGFNSNYANASVPAAGNVSQQTYSVIGTAANGCTATAIVNLNTLAPPAPSLSVTPRACVNSTISLQAAGGVTYRWRGPYYFSSSSQNVIFKVYNPAFAGIYTLTAYNAIGCKGEVTAALMLDEQPSGDLQSLATNYCIPFCSNFKLKLNTSVPLINTSWEIKNQVFNSPSFNYCFTTAGDYEVQSTYTNALGCSNTNTFIVTAYGLPIADFEFTPKKPVENMDPVEFSNTSTGINLNKWNWYFANDNKYRPSTESTSFLFENAGVYPVALIIENEFGCKDTIVKTITVLNDFDVFVPNSFTPNQDGLNDLFQAKGRGVKNFNLWIYNRWGEKIFQTNDLSKGWDGTLKGADCQADVYVWKILANDANGNQKDLNGIVTLYR